MGKFSVETSHSLIQSGRLTGFRGGHTAGGGDPLRPSLRHSFKPAPSRFDARLKLIQRERSPPRKDARDLLERRRKPSSHSPPRHREPKRNDTRPTTSRNNATNSPLMIITGIGNVRREGSKLKVLRSPTPPRGDRRRRSTSRTRRPSGGRIHSNDRGVRSEGSHTLVTLHNDRRPAKRHSPEKQQQQQHHSPPKYEPIKIKINNDQYKRTPSPPIPPVQQFNNTGFNKQNYENGNSSNGNGNTFGYEFNRNEDSMELDTHSYETVPAKSAPYQPRAPAPPAPIGYGFGLNSFQPSGYFNNNNLATTPAPYQPAASFGFGAASDTYFKNGAGGAASHSSNTSLSAAPAGAKHGYKLLVSNLHPRVTEDDVLELFSDIGPIKRARFIDKGLAEVIYVRLEHARDAVDKYDQKELDGRPMVIGFAEKSHQTEARNESRLRTNNTINTKLPPPTIGGIVGGSSNGSLYSSSLPSVVNHNNNTVNNAAARSVNSMSAMASALGSAASSLRNANPYFDPTSITTTVQAMTSLPPPILPKNVLSNRFKSLNSNSKEPRIQLPESKKYDLNNYGKVAVDSSIVQQVLFNKKPALNANPVTFTVKL